MPASRGVQGPGGARWRPARRPAPRRPTRHRCGARCSRPQLAEVMHEVEGEAVVIVDQRDIGHLALVRVRPRRCAALFSIGRGGLRGNSPRGGAVGPSGEPLQRAHLPSPALAGESWRGGGWSWSSLAREDPLPRPPPQVRERESNGAIPRDLVHPMALLVLVAREVRFPPMPRRLSAFLTRQRRLARQRPRGGADGRFGATCGGGHWFHIGGLCDFDRAARTRKNAP